MLVVPLAHSRFKDFICPISDYEKILNNVVFSLLTSGGAFCLVTIAKPGRTKWKKGMVYLRKDENKTHTPLRGRESRTKTKQSKMKAQ